MPVRMRLKRMGKKKHPSYRIVIADARAPRDGKFIETLGWYDPTAQQAKWHVDEEKAFRWLGQGVQPTETVRSILQKTGILQKLREMQKEGATTH